MESGKVCTKCTQWKPFNQFSRNKNTQDGLKCQCKECDAEYNQSPKGRASKRRYNRSPKGRQAQRRYDKTPKGKESRRRCAQARSARYPQKLAAEAFVRNAIRNGEIHAASELSCKDCGKQAEHYHHPSYKREHWLDVIPLCLKCHRARHEKAHSFTGR